MKIATIETMRADAGWRMFSFCKITTSDGLVGWSEYNEGFGSRGLSSVIDALAPLLLGHDALAWEARTAQLHVATRQSRGGLNQQAIAAIENALLDIAGKARGIPVYRLFGGPIRSRIPLYWSHFATYRVGARAALTGRIQLATRDDLAHHAAEVKEAGLPARSRPTFCPRVTGCWAASARLRRHARCPRAQLGTTRCCASWATT